MGDLLEDFGRLSPLQRGMTLVRLANRLSSAIADDQDGTVEDTLEVWP